MGVKRLHRRLKSVQRGMRCGLRAPVKRYQRTAVNTEAKLLLLTHAFERLDAIAVEFRTRYMNTAARSAILQLGTKGYEAGRQLAQSPARG